MENKIIRYLTVSCNYCKEPIKMLKCEHDNKIRNGSKNFYCSKLCRHRKGTINLICPNPNCQKSFTLIQSYYEMRLTQTDREHLYCSKTCKHSLIYGTTYKKADDNRFWSKVDKTPGLGPN